MELDHVTAYARERLGMQIQAATFLGAQPARGRRLEVWSLMTEHGWFWFVEEGSAVELFRGPPGGVKFAGVAVRQFLELHPERRTVARSRRGKSQGRRGAPAPRGRRSGRWAGARLAPPCHGREPDGQCCPHYPEPRPKWDLYRGAP